MANITKRGKGYRIKVSCGYDINGIQIIKSTTWTPEDGMTEKQIEKELQRKAVLFEEKCRNGQFIGSSIKFADFADMWMKEYGEKQLKAKTLARYRDLLQRTNQAIGHMKLDKIQPVHLLAFYDNLKEDGIRKDVKFKSKIDLTPLIINSYDTKAIFAEKAGIALNTLANACKKENVSQTTADKIASALNLKMPDIFENNSQKKALSDKTIRHYHRLISSILQTAVQWQVLISNPCDRVKPPKTEKRESLYLDDKEVLQLFNYLENEPLQYKAIIVLLVYTGMRRGEICGLKWSDVDFANSLLRIQRNLLYLPEKGIFEDTTKNESSHRSIKIADTALRLLQAHKIEQNKERLKCGDQWVSKDYIFTQWNGNPIHPDSLTGWFHKFVVKYNLPSVNIHSLRHTNASLLIANGINITTVSKRLGHSSTTTTTQIYAHAIKTADEIANDTLQTLLEIKTK